MTKAGTTKYFSNKQEKDVAKKFNARQVIASGAIWFSKADVRNSEYLIECKTTGNTYYSLTAKVWEKIEREAIKDHMRTPLMVIDLEHGKDRIIVFRPKDFGLETELSFPVKKSVRITQDSDSHTYVICGNKNNVICCLNPNDFNDIYERKYNVTEESI